MKIYSNLKWVFTAVVLSIFCRLFVVSIYRVSADSMAPIIITGDIILANQLSYGLKLPWKDKGYFVEEPVVNDVVAFKVRNKIVDEHHIGRISEELPNGQYIVKTDNVTQESSNSTISRDQILSKVLLIVLSVGTTQDSISEEKTVRWNRFLTRVK
jgi:signal peptidase I